MRLCFILWGRGLTEREVFPLCFGTPEKQSGNLQWVVGKVLPGFLVRCEALEELGV